MPRITEISVAPERTGRLVERLQRTPGVVGISLNPGTSIKPFGDVVTVLSTNEGSPRILELASELDLLACGSITTSEPRSALSRPEQDALETESNETIWEEMAYFLRRDTNLGINYLALMALSGVIAASGLWTNTVHVVVGAMVMAPGFEPLLRIPFGLIGGPRVLASRGLASAVGGYGALAFGAAITCLLLSVLDPNATDLGGRSWVQYWSTVGGTGIIVAIAAGAAGAIVVTAQRPVLTAGVMIALALVPSICIAAMAFTVGDFALAWDGLIRWAVEVAAVVVTSTGVLCLKQAFLHRRRSIA